MPNIIGGKYKRTKLDVPNNLVRPTSALKREAIFSILESNAFKYSVGKANPELRIDFKPKELVLSVKDYGLGIPEEQQLHLFEPFFRAGNVTGIQGTGLGLSIAKEYVEVNKGHITAKSILGEGSCFELTFKF